MTDRNDHLEARLRALLARRTPPRGIAGQALADEAESLIAAVLRLAPAMGYEAWWEAVARTVEERHRSRSWPTVGDIADAAREVRTRSPGHDAGPAAADQHREAAMVDLLERHFRATGAPLGGVNRASRTAALIRRGVLADAREARHRGFDLSPDQAAEARAARPSRTEWEHHVAVIGRLKGLMPDEAEAWCISASSGAALPEHLAHLDRGQPAGSAVLPRQGWRDMRDATARPRPPDEPPPRHDPLSEPPRPWTDDEWARFETIHGPRSSAAMEQTRADGA
ncbi:hypothetical protein [Rubellimicrobium sp. CFH 75288]|uniref:hypothetical protein n=1 Tax=Rubellimicrobium sp. CFH 75288 TaxID=2697034 RepID=UPI0014121153|nr:hypothetical protein [Rubellimicrobium sp. CFH 75288]NAZ37168.1 hypothetical protein [Rubellimicrobium sp. CFH 75288]